MNVYEGKCPGCDISYKISCGSFMRVQHGRDNIVCITANEYPTQIDYGTYILLVQKRSNTYEYSLRCKQCGHKIGISSEELIEVVIDTEIRNIQQLIKSGMFDPRSVVSSSDVYIEDAEPEVKIEKPKKSRSRSKVKRVDTKVEVPKISNTQSDKEEEFIYED